MSILSKKKFSFLSQVFVELLPRLLINRKSYDFMNIICYVHYNTTGKGRIDSVSSRNYASKALVRLQNET